MGTFTNFHLQGMILLTATLFTALPAHAANNSQSCPARYGTLSEADMEIARIAWQYFENNLQKETGLVNAADNYPSTTMWDMGSSLAAFIAAEKLGMIPRDRFDRMIGHALYTVEHLDLFNGEVPNKAYHTKTGKMIDYRNQTSERSIGVSALDLGRMASWLDILSCLYPHHAKKAQRIIESWNLCRPLEHGQMYGLQWDENDKVSRQQEGRLGYEQYSAKVFQRLGFDQDTSAVYRNMYSTKTEVDGVELLVDARDGDNLGGHNYVVSESYAMDWLEHGKDGENTPLVEAIFTVQQNRWEKTGQVTAVSEDNIDRKPYFVYNTIFSDGIAWNAITDKGEDMSALRTLSTKAAISLAYLFPERPYSKVLLDSIQSARNPKGGWYSGIYEDSEKGINKATTTNTNGVILSVMLYKLYGALHKVCSQCNKGLKLSPEYLEKNTNKQQCWAELHKKDQQ